MIMLTVEAMTGKAERFFQHKTQFPKERYPIVTVRDGEVLGGFMYYKDPTTGVMGVYLEKKSNGWIDSKTLAELVAFPFVQLGVDTVITTYSGTTEMTSFCKKMGAIFAKDNPLKVIYTRENALNACKVLRGEA